MGKDTLKAAEPWLARPQAELETHELAFLEYSRKVIAQEEQALRAGYTTGFQSVSRLALAETVMFLAGAVTFVYAYSSREYNDLASAVALLGIGVWFGGLLMGIGVILLTLRISRKWRRGEVFSPIFLRPLIGPVLLLIAAFVLFWVWLAGILTVSSDFFLSTIGSLGLLLLVAGVGWGCILLLKSLRICVPEA